MSRSKPSRNPDERRAAPYLVVVLVSTLAAYIIARQMLAASATSISADTVTFFTAAGALSGATSGVLFGEWYGHRGLSGILVTGFVSFIGPLLGGAIIGTIFFPVLGTVFGAYTAWSVFCELPYLSTWVVSVVLMHFAAGCLRGTLPASC
ncbi:hypothetical protein [Roseibium sp. M-1]